jgi:hypothetical protein
LLLHESEIALPLAHVEIHVLHRLDESGDDGERCFEFVRDVGNELAPHARGRFDSCDVS